MPDMPWYERYLAMLQCLQYAVDLQPACKVLQVSMPHAPCTSRLDFGQGKLCTQHTTVVDLGMLRR